ncbi:MAG: LysE family translocator [Anaerolineales bacterium]|nr:LysE family translocator [Anaerolineales bacterium]
MPDGSTLIVFIAAALALLLTPGPAVLYIVARSLDQGWRAGVVSALGVGTGTLCHVAAAALGLSALLTSSALAFAAVKYLGAAYLVFMGVRKWREKDTAEAEPAPTPRRLSAIYRQGVVVNLLNPKTALFVFAFVPQFVNPARGPVAGQIALLGCILVGLGVCSDSLYALLAGTLGQRLRQRGRLLRRQRVLTGGIFVALGLTAALSGSNTHA